MNENIHEQLKMDLYSCTYFSTCLNESRDITYSTCLAIIVCFVKDNKIFEELFNWVRYL
jgi:hypothetical protein